jgi:hypothetical protein
VLFVALERVVQLVDGVKRIDMFVFVLAGDRTADDVRQESPQA